MYTKRHIYQADTRSDLNLYRLLRMENDP
jgi:hypothetical protein